jgi:hypothetical protein
MLNARSHNRHGAEQSGYHESVDFFAQLDPTQVHTFYDSVCGVPLFRAPVGRSFEEWKAESIRHGATSPGSALLC